MGDISDLIKGAHPSTVSPSTVSSSSFTYTMTSRLQAALLRAGGDFRSDVVTVPTEAIMQESFPFL